MIKEGMQSPLYYNVLKRILDLILFIFFILLTWPIFLIVGFLIWKEDKHNPIYTQIRVGKDKKHFKIYKFRSMVVNADEILFNNPELYKQARSGKNKIKNDPRVTKIGRFIRKSSIDEFPQAFNVLNGDMSFIGPRALRPDEYELYEKKSDENKKKLEILTTAKPGISGYWQTSGRSNIDFDKRIDMECYYAKQRSFLFDLKLVFKTPFALLKGETSE